jgi:hypothetical protein
MTYVPPGQPNPVIEIGHLDIQLIAQSSIPKDMFTDDDCKLVETNMKRYKNKRGQGCEEFTA